MHFYLHYEKLRQKISYMLLRELNVFRCCSAGHAASQSVGNLFSFLKVEAKSRTHSHFYVLQYVLFSFLPPVATKSYTAGL